MTNNGEDQSENEILGLTDAELAIKLLTMEQTYRIKRNTM